MDSSNPLLRRSQQSPSFGEEETSAVENPLLKEAPTPIVEEPKVEERKPLSWRDVPAEAVKHLPESGAAAARGFVEPFLHPIQTYETGKELVGGLASKAAGALGMPQEEEKKAQNEAVVNAIKDFYVNRYGSEEGFKRALAEDPVGVMADVSTILGGGGGALARVPGVVGRTGEVVSAAGRAISPINVAARAATPVISSAQKAATYPLAIKTGVSPETMRTAFKAGQEGSKPFFAQLTGKAEPSEIVDAAHEATNALRDKRRSDYLASKEGWAANQQPIDYSNINKALVEAEKDVMHGSRVYRPEAKAMLDKLKKEINDWQNTPTDLAAIRQGTSYHGVEGVDKLKQLVGDIRSTANPGSPAEALGTKIYNTIKDTIVEHDPNYQTAMGQYSDASDTLKQLKSTLSLNPNASVDTTLRKLLLAQKQADGSKASLLNELKEVDPEIGNMIAGHLLHPIVPTGITGKIGAALSLTPHAGAFPAIDPVTAALNVVSSSPRAMGAASYGLGRMTAPGGGLPSMALMPSEITKAVPKKEEIVEEERPYFNSSNDQINRAKGGRIHRATGGTVKHGMTAKALISAVDAARNKISKQTKAILNQPDERVATALKVANNHI